MKKIISIISVVSFTFLFITSSFTVYADDGSYTTFDYLKEFWTIQGKFVLGNYNYQEYLSATEACVARGANLEGVYNTLQSVLAKVKQTYDKYGDVAIDYIKSALFGLMSDYQTSEQVSTTDMHGYGALVEIYDGTYVIRWWAEYITYKSKQNCTLHGMGASASGYSPDVFSEAPSYRDVNGFTFYQIKGYINVTDVKYYGDIRYSDGTQAPTDDEYGIITKYDFTQKSDPENPDNTIPTTEQELSELLDEINEELERLNPDLTSTDEILKSIYYRLGALDSDDDNELLSEILSAINSIKNNSADTDNSDLLKILEEIKKSLVFEDGENSATLAEELKQIIDNQLTADDFTIDEESYSNNGEILKLRLLGKFSFINELKEFVTYIFDTYKNSSDSPEISIEIYGESYLVDMELFKEYLPLVQSILAAFIYISYGYHTYRKIPSYINGGDNE